MFEIMMDDIRSRANFKKTILWIFAILTFFLIGVHQINALSSSKQEESIFKQLKMFANVLEIVKENYVKEVSIHDLIYGAIDGMLKSLDPHSSFMKPEAYKELQIETKGSFSGIGIVISIKDGMLTVVSPIEGTPAYKIGLKSGDKIVKIGGKSTKDMSLMDAVKLIRGKKGTKVTLSIFREGWRKLKDFSIIRDIIPIISVKHHLLDDKYGYIRIRNFQKKTIGELQNALKEIEKESGGLLGLIIDLRNNPGGLLDQAVKVADEFIDSGLIVYIKGRIKGQEMKFEAHSDNGAHSYPIVAVVNQGSASASEIVAGALQDHKRAIIIGEQTFGKGSVQTVIPLEDGAAVRLTTALYYTPNGRSIQAKGIEPDIVVPFVQMDKAQKEKDGEAGHFVKEKDLEGHLPNIEELEKMDVEKEDGNKNKDTKGTKLYDDNGKDKSLKTSKDTDKSPKTDNGSSNGKSAKDDEIKRLMADNQIEEALRILKAWNIFKASMK